VNDIMTLEHREPKKLAELVTNYAILEKITAVGEVRILPRTFADHKEAVEYLADIDEALKSSSNTEFRSKAHQYFIVPVTSVTFLL